MTKAIILLHFLFIGFLLPPEGPDQHISCHVDNMPFPEFCDYIFKESGVRVYYKDVWVSNIRVTIDSNDISVRDALHLAVKGSGLEISEWRGELVILPGKKLLESLPDYTLATLKVDTSTTSAKSITESEERYIKGRKADVTQTIRIGKKDLMNSNSSAKILGRITDQESGEAVIGATMYLEETGSGTATDQNGFLSMVLKPGKYTARFSCLGYKSIKYLLDVLSDGEFNVKLKKSVIQMQEVVVYGDRQMNIRFKDPGLEKISSQAIKEIPMLMGERDILKVSEMLPGIVSVGEGSAGLNVRGGGADQNAFYINKVPVYNTSHMFGFFPAFNADIIKDFSIYKGHIPAQYGGRLSSVFNIITRQGNRKHFTARGGLSPVAANLIVEGPLKKDTCSFFVSGRSTYSDWIIAQIDDPLIKNSRANFYDFSAGLNYDLQKTQMSLFFYRSEDYFRLSDINTYKYSNSGASLSFSHNFSTSLRADFSLIGAQYGFTTTDQLQASNAYEHSYNIGHYEAKADFSQNLNHKNSLEYGLDFIYYELDRGTVKPFGAASLRSPIMLGKERGFESSLYLADNYDILPWINLNLGIRYWLFNPLGPKTVYTYASGLPKDIRYISDTLKFSDGQAIRWYTSPELRVAVNIETDPEGSVKLAFNQMHQSLFMLTNTISIAPNTQWKLADYHLKPSRSNQVSAGVFRTFPKFALEASVELYYKTTSELPAFIDGADFLNTPLIETMVLPGKQKAYGAEFLLRRNGRRLDGWLAYTYSRSIIKVNGTQAWDKINNGEAYPANYDIPHVVDAVVNYHFSRRVTVSAVLSYQSGKPITYPTSIYYVNGIPYIDYSKRNEYRIPDYFRTDLSLSLEGNLRRHKLLHSSLTLNLYNVTGRENPYSVYYISENGRINSYQYSVIGVPIFTITWIFKLGNYASD